jgi:hypothetical protein
VGSLIGSVSETLFQLVSYSGLSVEDWRRLLKYDVITTLLIDGTFCAAFEILTAPLAAGWWLFSLALDDSKPMGDVTCTTWLSPERTFAKLAKNAGSNES